MKCKIVIVLCSLVALVACSSSSTDKNSTPAATPVPAAKPAKKSSMYDGIQSSKVEQCMGKPAAIFTANNHDYWRYFTPSRCEVLFIVNKDNKQVDDVKYIFPHAFTRYGYAVSEKQCPLKQQECLLG